MPGAGIRVGVNWGQCGSIRAYALVCVKDQFLSALSSESKDEGQVSQALWIQQKPVVWDRGSFLTHIQTCWWWGQLLSWEEREFLTPKASFSAVLIARGSDKESG